MEEICAFACATTLCVPAEQTLLGEAEAVEVQANLQVHSPRTSTASQRAVRGRVNVERKNKPINILNNIL